MGARKPCKNHAFFMILLSMPFFASIFQHCCFLKMSVLPAWELIFYQLARLSFSAKLKKQLRDARDLPFPFASFLFSFCSPPWLVFWGPGAGDRHQNRPRWGPHRVLIWVVFDLISDLEPDLWPISCRSGLDLGSLSCFGFDLAFDLGSIWGRLGRSGIP